MWYQRIVSWIRSLFTTSSVVNDQSASSYAGPPTLPLTAPLRGPVGALDQGAPPPPPRVEFPPHREPPTTVPLARLAQPSQPLTGMPASSDGLGPLHALWSSREPSHPSHPLQPQTGAPISGDAAWPELAPEPVNDLDQEGGDEETPPIEPGSDLYRRLMILRRLVRQRIYNEGFPADATPEQYQRYSGQDELDNPFNAQ